jgi:hypothetical protein
MTGYIAHFPQEILGVFSGVNSVSRKESAYILVKLNSHDLSKGKEELV